MKTLLFGLLLVGTSAMAQTSNLVNYDYTYNGGGYTQNGVAHIEWEDFPDFNLPSNYVITWFPVFAHHSEYDIMTRKGFSHTQSWMNQLQYQYSDLGGSFAPWHSPISKRYIFLRGVNQTCYYGFDLLNPAKYNEAKLLYKNAFESNGLAGTESDCPRPPGNPSLVVNSDLSDYYSVFKNIGGQVVKNQDVVAIDFEQVYNLQHYYNISSFDNFLQCVQNPSCNASNSSYGGYGFLGGETQRIGMPSSYATLPFADFKKQWFRAKIKEMYCPYDAYLSISTSTRAPIENWPANLHDPMMMLYAEQNNIPWSTVISDPAYISMLYKDTATFTQFGNHLFNAQDVITPEAYSSWHGRYGDWSYSSGDWITHLLSQVEFTKAWTQGTGKKSYPYLWTKNDGFKADDPNIPNGDEQPNEDYSMFASPTKLEGEAIFTIMAGADGMNYWDAEWSYYTDQDHYKYCVKGLHRLSHFNHFLADPNRIYVQDKDPFQIRDLRNANTQFGVWRGIVSGDSILIAAMNPSAPNDSYQTQCIINYQGWSDTITLVGRKTFLGSAKWNNGGGTTCILPSLGSSIRSSCNGITTIKIPGTIPSQQIEWSLDNVNWQPSNWNGNGFEWTVNETTACVPFWARLVGCVSPVVAGCKIGTAPCMDTTNCVMPVFGTPTVSSCNGTTTVQLTATNSTLSIEYSLDNVNWQSSNWNGNGFQWTFPETTNCVNFWARMAGCPTTDVNADCVIGTGACSTAGVESMTNTHLLNAYPNPFNNVVTISCSNQLLGSTIEIKDLRGSVVFQSQISETNFVLDVSKFSRGTYLISVSNDQISMHKRIIKY